MGLRDRQNRNDRLRANGIEPKPSIYAGVKHWRRYHRRNRTEPVKVKNPERYLHSVARRFAALRKVLALSR